MALLTKLFSGSNRFLRRATQTVAQINALENALEGLSQAEIQAKVQRLQEHIRSFEQATANLPLAFALVREVAKRTLGQRHYDEQILGAIGLHYGKVVEMKTGEGKTLAATMPVFLNALIGKGVHLVTVNDYLAMRDTVWMGQIYHFLGLSVGCVTQDGAYLYDPKVAEERAKLDQERDEKGAFKVVHEFLRPVSRQEAYRAHVTYGTNNVFGFDYLRDNLVFRLEDKVQRGLYYAILDEIDSILIDEARTPLIISSPDEQSSQLYQQSARLIAGLKTGRDFTVDLKHRSVQLTNEGITRLEKALGVTNLYDPSNLELLFHIEQALKARALFKRDKDYVVKDNQVIIVDEFTGRLMPDRRFSEGLHQALEAKEGLEVRQESKTLATISFQNFFRKYQRLAGMTGTAKSSEEEFQKVYGLDVLEIPTHQPMIRKDWNDRVFATGRGKLKAVVREVKKRYERGQPVLVGTTSIETNEQISRELKKARIPHQVLNAKHHEQEAMIIAQAGRKGMVTVATNMAGRGVDIILGGNPPDPKEAQEVRDLGGLFVLGTERHEARRIDDQLRGRAGRQGDPGESVFFVSLEDELMKAFGSDRAKEMLRRLGVPEDQPIENRLISRSIESAQKRIEGYNFDLRKHLLQFDEVVNVQREAIYKLRDEILQEAAKNDKTLWKRVLALTKEVGGDAAELKKRFEGLPLEALNRLLARLLLSILDNLWIHHLSDLDYLRSTVGLRAYGQRDPLIEYKKEAQGAYQDLLDDWKRQVVETLTKLELLPDVSGSGASLQSQPRNLVWQGPAQIQATVPSGGQAGLLGGQPPKANRFKGVGRNDPCPCNSGKKFKKCHGKV